MRWEMYDHYRSCEGEANEQDGTLFPCDDYHPRDPPTEFSFSYYFPHGEMVGLLDSMAKMLRYNESLIAETEATIRQSRQHVHSPEHDICLRRPQPAPCEHVGRLRVFVGELIVMEEATEYLRHMVDMLFDRLRRCVSKP
jgi:hypothetical protein